MRLEELFAVVDRACPDLAVGEFFDPIVQDVIDDGEVDDTFGLFIAREVMNAYDEDASEAEQLGEIIKAMDAASDLFRQGSKALRTASTP